MVSSTTKNKKYEKISKNLLTKTTKRDTITVEAKPYLLTKFYISSKLPYQVYYQPEILKGGGSHDIAEIFNFGGFGLDCYQQSEPKKLLTRIRPHKI